MVQRLEGIGLDGVAVVSAIFAADDISSAVIDLKAKAVSSEIFSLNLHMLLILYIPCW